MSDLPPFVTSDTLTGLPGVQHGFFGRRGGVSGGLYASLNVGEGSGDAPDAVAANRERVRAALSARALLSCYQIHSALSLIHI